MTLTQDTYKKLIAQDIECLDNSNVSKLEKEHIKAVLIKSVELYESNIL